MRCALAALLLALATSAGAEPPKSVALREAIAQAIGSAQCRADTDCASLPLGERPCGGPEEYLPYAPAQVNALKLADLVARHQAERRKEQAGRVSTCVMRVDPGARCQQGRCVAGA